MVLGRGWDRCACGGRRCAALSRGEARCSLVDTFRARRSKHGGVGPPCATGNHAHRSPPSGATWLLPGLAEALGREDPENQSSKGAISSVHFTARHNPVLGPRSSDPNAGPSGPVRKLAVLQERYFKGRTVIHQCADHSPDAQRVHHTLQCLVLDRAIFRGPIARSRSDGCVNAKRKRDVAPTAGLLMSSEE